MPAPDAEAVGEGRDLFLHPRVFAEALATSTAIAEVRDEPAHCRGLRPCHLDECVSPGAAPTSPSPAWTGRTSCRCARGWITPSWAALVTSTSCALGQLQLFVGGDVAMPWATPDLPGLLRLPVFVMRPPSAPNTGSSRLGFSAVVTAPRTPPVDDGAGRDCWPRRPAAAPGWFRRRRGQHRVAATHLRFTKKKKLSGRGRTPGRRTGGTVSPATQRPAELQGGLSFSSFDLVLRLGQPAPSSSRSNRALLRDAAACCERHLNRTLPEHRPSSQTGVSGLSPTDGASDSPGNAYASMVTGWTPE